MHDTFLTTVYNSLGGILKKLYTEQQIQNSEELLKQVTDGIKFHADMQEELDALVNDNRKLTKELAESQKYEIVDTHVLQMLHNKYQILHDLGANSKVIYKISIDDKVNSTDRIKIIATMFNLTWDQAEALIRQFKEEGLDSI